MTLKSLEIKNPIIDTELHKYQLERFKQFSNFIGHKNFLRKPINPATAIYFYYNSNAVANCIDILGEDVVLTNYINLKSETHEVEELEYYLNNSYFKIEYANIYKDYELFGAGCGIITPSEDNPKFFDIFHVPQNHVSLLKAEFEDRLYIIACQYIGGKGENVEFNYYKLDNVYYPKGFDSYNNKPLNLMHWLGQGQFYGHYNTPWLIQVMDEAAAQLALKKLDYDTFSTGNNSNGIVYFNQVGVKKMQINLPDSQLTEKQKRENSLDEANFNSSVIRTSINKAGSSNALIYHESDDPMDIKYIPLGNDNFKYLMAKDTAYGNAIMERARIPNERLMSSNSSESINSQKTTAIWEIYVNNINARQQLPEMRLRELIQGLYGMEKLSVEFEVPLFANLIETKIKYISTIYDKGFVTLRTAIDLLGPYLNHRIDASGIEDKYLDMIYYNGISYNFSTEIGDLSLDAAIPPLHIRNEVKNGKR